MRDVLSATASSLLGLVYPELCVRCERRVHDPDRLPVCDACLRRLPRPDDGAVAVRLAARDEGAAFAQDATALWRFDSDGAVQRLQHALKYKGRPRLGRHVGTLLAEAIAREQSTAFDAVVPVPLAPTRLLERGYNQSEALAEGVAGRLGCPLRPDLLRRTRATRSQTRLGFAERWANVDGAFEAAGDDLAGTRLLLVDDVLTTGATLLAAARPLTQAGASVSLAVLALAT